MRMKNSWVIAILAITLTGCATAKEQHLSDGYRLISAEEIRQLHSNKTHRLDVTQGMTIVAYYTEDGRSTFRRSDVLTAQGVWEIRGERICYYYPKLLNTENNCHTIAVKDGQYVMFKEYSGRVGNLSGEFRAIESGNTENLPLE